MKIVGTLSWRLNNYPTFFILTYGINQMTNNSEQFTEQFQELSLVETLKLLEHQG
jgi:hypothetical protein